MSERNQNPARLPPRAPARMRAQHGAALMIALILLLVMTVAGVSSMRNSTLEERMAGNTRDREVAFQAAEGALRAGEAYLNSFTSTPSPGASSYIHTDDNAPETGDFDCTGSDVQVIAVNDEAASDACYFIAEKILTSGTISTPGQPVQDKKLYQVVARGFGLTNRAQVVLRSSYVW